MSTVLDKYNLTFNAYKLSNNSKAGYMNTTSTSLVSYQIVSYFSDQSISYLTDVVLININNAIAGLPFESDAGGVMSYLEIAPVNCTFSSIDESKADVTIPTQDTKDILLAWTQWAISNGLENMNG